MKRFTTLLTALCLCLASMAFTKVNKSIDITVNGLQRSYWLYVPDGCPTNAPLVIAMHGTTGHSTDNSPRFNEIADKEKFIVAYPQGRELYFPVFGGNATGWEATGEYSEDVDFIRSVVTEVSDKYKVDRKRVYCCGFSNGGMNTYSLTNFCTDIFAAFASISGFPINEFHHRHVSARPVPFLHIHGKADDFVKYSLVPAVIDNMVARNGACPVPERTSVAGKYDKNVYAAQDGGFPVIFYEVDGMGHNDFTTNTEEGNSSLTMWNFFKQYTLDSPCDTTLKWKPCIETENYEPKKHGWIVNAATVLLMFGRDQKTSANQNVYRSLQFTDGTYKLCFKSEGEEGTKLSVKLTKQTGNHNSVIDQDVTVGENHTIFFKVDDGWGEYRLTIKRPSSSDVVKITDMAIYTATEEEATAIETVKKNPCKDITAVYSLNGTLLSSAQKGLCIVKSEDGSVRTVFNK